MLAVIFALLLCGSAYSTTVWPQGCYNSQRSSFATPRITPHTLECQPTLTSTIPIALSSSGHPDLDVDPVVGNHSVLYYVNEANALTALDVNTNTVLWTIKGNSSFSAPVLSQDGDLLYTLKDTINFTVYSVETQEVVWYYDRIPSGKFEKYLKNIVIAPNGVAYLNMLEFQASNLTILYAFDISKPVNTELWNRTDINFFINPSVSEDGKLYVSDTEFLYSLNPSNGSTIWKLAGQFSEYTGGVRVRSDGNVLAKTDRNLNLISPEGKLIAVANDFEDYVVTPENQVIGVKISEPNTVIALLNSNFSKFEWNVTLQFVSSSLIIDAIDDEIYVHAVEFESGKAMVIKLNMHGNVTWTTELQYTPDTRGFAFSNVIPVGDGSVVLRAGNFLYHLTTCNAGHGTCKTAGGVCECEASYFGDNCSIQCECGENGKCSAQGQCECNEGWKGDKCSDKDSEPSNKNLIIGLSVGGGVLVIGAIAAFCLVRHRRRAQYEAIKH